MTARMNRRLYGFFSKRLDEAGLDQVPDSRDDRANIGTWERCCAPGLGRCSPEPRAWLRSKG
jgi:hypothetical protein